MPDNNEKGTFYNGMNRKLYVMQIVQEEIEKDKEESLKDSVTKKYRTIVAASEFRDIECKDYVSIKLEDNEKKQEDGKEI